MRANDKNVKSCCITRGIILIKYYSSNQKRGVYFLRCYFYILISLITFDSTKIEPWSRSLSGNSIHRTLNLLPLPVEQPQWVRVRRLYIRSQIKWKSRMLTSTGERAKEGQVYTWSRGLLDCEACAILFFLGWKNDFAHCTDVPRAIWLCDLQIDERRHNATGEVSERWAGWLDGIQKYLKRQTHTHKHTHTHTHTYNISVVRKCYFRWKSWY